MPDNEGMSRKTVDREDGGHHSRALPSLHEVLGESYFQSTRASSRQGSSDSQRSKGSLGQYCTWPPLGSHPVLYQDHGYSHRGPQLAPISRSRSAQPHCPQTPSSEPSTSSQRLRPISSSRSRADPHSRAQTMSSHSYDLFDYSPDQGLVHKKTSQREEDLDESRPKPRTSSVDDALRRYVCSECGKRFAKPSTLRNHTLTHTGEKPFACPHPGCGRWFSMASNMQRHMRTHTSGSAFEIVPSREDLQSGKHYANDHDPR